MTRRIKNGVKRGGVAIPLESNVFMLNGKSHKNGGIDIDKTVEAQGGEIMRRFGPDQMQILSKENNFIHGNPVKNYLSGMSFDDAFKLQQIDNVLQGRKSSVHAKYGIETEYDRIKRTMAKHGTNKQGSIQPASSTLTYAARRLKRAAGRTASNITNIAEGIFSIPDRIIHAGSDAIASVIPETTKRNIERRLPKIKSTTTRITPTADPMSTSIRALGQVADNIKDKDYRSLANAALLLYPGKGMKEARRGAAGTGGARTTRAKKTSTAQTTLNFTPDYQSMTPTDLEAGRARVKAKGEIRHSSSHRPVIKDGKTVYETTAENAKQSTIAAKGTAHRMSNHTLLDLLGGVSEHSAKREAVAATTAKRRIILAAGEKRKNRPGGVNTNVGPEEVGTSGYLIDRRHVTDNPNLHLTEDVANLRQINRAKHKQAVAKYNKESKEVKETNASIERGLAQEPYLLSGSTNRHRGRVIRNRFGIVKDVKFGPRIYGFKKSVTDPKTGKTYTISDIEKHYDKGYTIHPFSGEITSWTLPENVSFENGAIVTREINTRHSASAWRKNRPYTGNRKNTKSVNNTTERITRTTNNTTSNNNTQSKSSSKWVKYGKRTGYGLAGVAGAAGIINAFRPQNQNSGFTNNDAYGVDENLSGRFVYADPDERDTDTIGNIGNAMHHDSVVSKIYDANGDTAKLNQISDTTRRDSTRRKKRYGGNSIPLRASGNNRIRAFEGVEVLDYLPEVKSAIEYNKNKKVDNARRRLKTFIPSTNVVKFNGIRRKAEYGDDGIWYDPVTGKSDYTKPRKYPNRAGGLIDVDERIDLLPKTAPGDSDEGIIPSKTDTPSVARARAKRDRLYGSLDTDNPKSKVKLFSGFNGDDLLSAGINTVGTLGSFFINNHYLNKMKEPSVPILASAPKLRTRYNINPQLSETREGFSNAINNVRNNTANSMTARNSINDYFNNMSLANNKLYSDKENKEISLINEDNKLRGEYNSRKAATINDYNNRRNAFYNDIYEKKSENWNAMFNNFNAIAQHTLDNKQKRNQSRLDYLSTLAPYVNIIAGNDKARANALYRQIMNGITLI